ncbi:MAG: 50S ribosomal protein L3 N(5)-glutamine methyltransferase [Methylococcaceae bacterium]|jgi:ribosomal protein L3 glutamine methyltransferase
MMTMPADVINTLSTMRDYIRWGASCFKAEKLYFGHGTATALDEAVALVLYSLHLPYDLSERYFDTVLTKPERATIIDLFGQRIAERKPAAYLTHEAMFAGLSFYVDERVLVPRSPIAELIAQRFSPWVEEEAVSRILDLCTGSGCIAIACAYAFPDALVDAVDISLEALAVAQINVEKHQTQDVLDIYESDLFNDLPDTQYDIIVSNPPYVCLQEWEGLPAEFHAEPDIGFKAGVSGLDIVLRILAESVDFLSDDGILVVEVGNSAEALQTRLPEVPFYWLAFENGGEGVFLLTAEQVSQYHEVFLLALN